MPAAYTDTCISEAQRRQYKEEGFFVLERAIPDEHLELLRDECAHFVRKTDAEMKAAGQARQGITHAGKRYFIAQPSLQRPRLFEFLRSELMAELCRATLGPTAYVFYEQYVVKGAEQGLPFSWHQDSGYVADVKHQPYLTCWCALDDMSEHNGTAYILPYSRAGTRGVVPHVRDPQTNDLVGYHGDDPGDPVLAPAGSIAVFSSVTFHRSGQNRSPNLRRVYLAQYGAEPIRLPDGKDRARCELFLKDGKIVPNPAKV